MSEATSPQVSQTETQTGLDPNLFAGVLNAIRPQGHMQELAVTDDLDGEGETLGGTVPEQSLGPSPEDHGLGGAPVADSGLRKAVDEASKGVSERTHDEYRRYVLHCLAGHVHCQHS